MATDRFFIAPYDQNSGLQTNVRPWLIPDDAFANLTNAYVFRGRVRKRFGSRWFLDNPLLSRFRVGVGSTNSSGTLSGTVPVSGPSLTSVGAQGQWFSIGTVLFTVNTTGALLISGGSATTATFDFANGEFVFTAVYNNATIPVLQANMVVYWYPGFPAMGLLTYETAIVDNQLTIGFDTSYSYLYNGGCNYISTGANTWTGNDSQFFWGATWTAANASSTVFFVTNFNAPDGIRYYSTTAGTWAQAIFNYDTISLPGGAAVGITDGSGNASGTVAGGSGFIGESFIIGNTIFTVTATSGALTVASLTSSAAVGAGTFNTSTGAYTFTGASATSQIYFTDGNVVNTAAIIVVFKNRLLLFNTVENGLPYVNRCRFSQIGNVLDPAAWLQSIPGRGGAIDEPTVESINTVEFVKDRLIVFFEQSTWEVVYTGNQVLPFVWQQINTELGAESSFSVVPFDKVALCVGNVGVHACNGSNVERVDDKIPDQVFTVSNANNGIYRVYGIRDYFVEQVYWSYPSTDTSTDSYFPNRVLVFNYKTGTWALNWDCITCFGYFNPQNGVTWSNNDVTWDDAVPWDSDEVQLLFRQVIAGNQEGFTFVCDADITSNAAVLQITDVITNPVTQLTIINHTIEQGEFVYIIDCSWSDSSNGLNGQIFQVIGVIDVNNIEIGPIAPFTGNYSGGGLVARVSQLDIQTKEYNFYAKEGRNSYVSKVDFMVDKTGAGQITVNFYDSTSTSPLLQDGLYNGVTLGTGVLETFPYTAANGVPAPVEFEQNQVRLWHPVYLLAEGEVIQMQLTMTDAQMTNVALMDEDFQLHAMCIYAQPTTMRFQ